jgi:hypothetical protein
MLAQGAVSAIKSGCAMLQEGRMEIENAKSAIEGAVGDAKAIVSQLSGLWAWLKGLFAPTSDTITSSDKVAPNVVKKSVAKQQQSYEELELKVISEVGANLGVLFDTQQQINNHYHELEEESKTNYDPTQNNSKKAIERALIELQMEKLLEQTREAMVYAPAELKDLYSRFLVMHGKIEQEQAWARSEMIRRARLARWRKEQQEIRCIEITSGVFAVTFISLIFGWMMWQLRNLSGGF